MWTCRELVFLPSYEPYTMIFNIRSFVLAIALASAIASAYPVEVSERDGDELQDLYARTKTSKAKSTRKAATKAKAKAKPGNNIVVNTAQIQKAANAKGGKVFDASKQFTGQAAQAAQQLKADHDKHLAAMKQDEAKMRQALVQSQSTYAQTERQAAASFGGLTSRF